MSDIFSAVVSTIEADLKSAWGSIEHAAEDVIHAAEADALVLWDDFRAIVTAALPTEYSALKGFILTALQDVQNGDLADIETAVLNLARNTETWVEGIGSATLQAIIGVVKAGVDKASA